MKRFLLLYNGPAPAAPPPHEGWPEWFDRIGDALVDVGSPMMNGFATTATARRATRRRA
jgi:hypothetical protein